MWLTESPIELIDTLNLPDCNINMLDDSYTTTFYRTTNRLFIVGSYVFKVYNTERSFLAERAVYNARKYLSFDLPNYAQFVKLRDGSLWLVMEYVRGETLFDYLKSGTCSPNICDMLISKIIQSIVEFEFSIEKFATLSPKIILYNESMEWISSLISEYGYVRESSALRMAISDSDSMLMKVRRVPCFDAFMRNIIVQTTDKDEISLVFCDFDKADRYNPMGEQLTHLMLDDTLGQSYDRVLREYVSLSSQPYQLIEQVLLLTTFLRALASVRDSLRWIPKDVQSITEAQDILDRITIARWGIEKAKKNVRNFVEVLGKRQEERSGIEGALEVLVEITAAYHTQATQAIREAP